MTTQQDPNKVIYEEEFTGPTKELRLLGALAYFPGGFILPYLLEHSDKPFVLFHVKQGFVLFSILLMLALFPISGSSGLSFFLYLILGAWHGYRAYQGEEYQIEWVRKLIEGMKQK